MAITGRPPADDPKTIQVKFRVGKQTDADIKYCSKALDKSRSDILRMGVALVKAEVDRTKK